MSQKNDKLMTLALPDFLIDHPDGEVRVVGHRISLYHVLEYYNRGFTPEMIAAHLSSLPLVLIYKTITFYLENQSDIDVYLANYRAELDRLEAHVRATSRTPTLEELRERLAKRRQASEGRL